MRVKSGQKAGVFMSAKECGEFISQLRKEHNLTQKQLAEKLHVSDKAISRWETGKGYPDVSSLLALSEFFDVSVNELLAGARLEKESLPEIAEQNLIGAMQSQEKEVKKKKRQLIIISVLFFVLLLPAAIPTFIYFIDSAVSVASTENLTQFIVIFTVGLLLFASGFSVSKGNISLMHSYHYHRVVDREGYCKAMGKTIMIMGIPVALSSLSALFPSIPFVESAGTVILLVSLLVGCVFLFKHQYKYNGGLF